MSSLRLASLVIERRKTALVLFSGLQIERVVTHTLPTDMAAAHTSLAAFLRRILERQQLDYISVEAAEIGWSDRIVTLHVLAKEMLRTAGIPLAEVALIDLLSAYGSPPPRRREQLRKTARPLWPSLDNHLSDRCSIDAATLGLHVQIERMFALAEAEA